MRLAPSMRSQKGAIWTKQTVAFQWWEVDIMFRVSGRGRIGADGLVSTVYQSHMWNCILLSDNIGQIFMN